MAVRVDRADSSYTVHGSATKWVIDEYQQLHVVGPDGNVASYGRGAWDFAGLLSLEELEHERATLGAEASA